MARADAMPHVGTTLRALRERSGLTQAAVAEGVGKSRALVSLWESGRVTPQLGDLADLLDLCGATDDERLALLTREAPAAAS